MVGSPWLTPAHPSPPSTHTHTAILTLAAAPTLRPSILRRAFSDYDDFHDLSNEKRAGFFAGVCSTFFGVYLITSKRDSAGKYDTLVNEGDSAAAATEHRTEAGQSRHRLHVPLLGGENRSRSPSGSSLSGLSPVSLSPRTRLPRRPPRRPSRRVLSLAAPSPSSSLLRSVVLPGDMGLIRIRPPAP